MATLYSQAASNVRRTWFLMALFLILIIGLGYVFSYLYDNYYILYIAVAIAFIQSFASYWFSDKIVLSMTGAKLVSEEENRELYHIVENLTIASGLPMPKIYIMEEAQPNAFATGRDEKHAVVAVTRGLLEKLEKVELEGVIAHELSHIKNKDILLSTVVVVLVGAIALLSDLFFRISFWGGGGERKKGGALVLILGIAAAILAPLAAALIQLAISRKREFLADASGALMTRYPEGLASALQKIAGDASPMKSANNSTAHLFISSPFKGKKKNILSKLFMTHPPTEERIEALTNMRI
ncbi:MAG: M48 family metallopeptidase [Candidatus Paceibacterota bacterium]|jgi:heat shock protein HtpX|nr:M48 family metallopeptidase [Candidatus Paceibacterota bacterium]MDD4875410.1 M48 family metallopeptidase [Candidatus Paceibacterota bacterium]